MNRWKVIVTKDVTMSAVVEVEAETAEQANDKALDIALQGKVLLPWELDDGSGSDPYLGDPDNVEEIE